MADGGGSDPSGGSSGSGGPGPSGGGGPSGGNEGIVSIGNNREEDDIPRSHWSYSSESQAD